MWTSKEIKTSEKFRFLKNFDIEKIKTSQKFRPLKHKNLIRNHSM